MSESPEVGDIIYAQISSAFQLAGGSTFRVDGQWWGGSQTLHELLK